MIQPSSWKLVAAFAAIKAAAAPTNKGPTFGAWIDDEGITNLYGNSFGRPGYNETFDYIVSCRSLHTMTRPGRVH